MYVFKIDDRYEIKLSKDGDRIVANVYRDGERIGGFSATEEIHEEIKKYHCLGAIDMIVQAAKDYVELNYQS